MAAFVLLTEDRYLRESPGDWYVEQIFAEDRLLIDALERGGSEVRRASWEGPLDYQADEILVFRTTWNYFAECDRFLAWLNQIPHPAQLCNSLSLVHWNLDKRYLFDLQRAGVLIIPTLVSTKSKPLPLAAALEAWPEAAEYIIKPVRSQTAYLTYRLLPNEMTDSNPLWAELSRDRDFFIQPFMPSIVNEGEYSFIVIGGVCTHAVLKKPKANDFRVQDDHGGTVHPHTVHPHERLFAEAAVLACPEMPYYARVDAIVDQAGKLRVMELEVIEPELFLRFNPPAAATLADSLQRFSTR